MKFKTFLFESITEPEEAAEVIKRDCSKFLAENDGLPLYRGMSIEDRNLLLKKIDVPKNRQPKDLNQKIHDLIDDYLKERFGIRFRSEYCLFCSGDRKVASEYGDNLYYLFPIGDFKFCWSDIIKDAYTFFDSPSKYSKSEGTEKIEQSLNIEIPNYFVDYKLTKIDEYLDIISKYLYKVHPYKDKNLGEAIRSGNEIMVSCKEAYIIKTNSLFAKKVFEELE